MKNFVVYKSSAGSGKTFTLVLEYLRICLQDPKALNYNYKKILAITFTNKAAAEMKSRVIEALHQISTQTELNEFGRILKEQLNIDTNEFQRRAKVVLSQILHHYSDFSIGTIDSFTHRLVKTFSFDLKLPNNFTIEMDTNGFHNKVIALLLNKIGEDEYISHLLKEFANINAENNDTWDPEKQLKEFTNLLLQENSSEFIQKLNHFNVEELETFRQQFIDFIKHFENKITSLAKKAVSAIETNGLQENDFIHSKSGPQNFFNKCLNLSIKMEDISGPRLMAAIEQGKWWSKNNKNINQNVENTLIECARALVDFIDQNFKAYTLCKLLSKQMYVLMLLKKIEEISQELKTDEHIVFLSEFNQKISEIIANEPTPFIYERLGEKYHHYLIDEFQDTSSLQWHNLIPLVENSLSSGWYNLLVGDGKQSIYRWRNANVIQFASLPNIANSSSSILLAQHQLTIERNYEEKFLTTNFRSKANVIHFNNSFFEFMNQKVLTPSFQKIYHKHQQQINAKNENNENDGYVSIQILNDSEISKIDFYLKEILVHIQTAIQNGYSYEDICVLVRKNQHGSIVAQHLSQSGIPVISSDSLLLKNNLEVNTIVSILEYQVDSTNVISAAAIFNFLWQTERINAVNYHLSLELLSQKKSLQSILEKYDFDLPFTNNKLNNVFDTCIDAIHFLKIKSEASPYVRFFLDEVVAFLNQHNASVSKFLEWWDKRKEKASLIIPKGSNAVNVMTIHSSKGLEFPIVIIPFCDWILNQRSNKWVNVNSQQTALPVAVLNLTQSAALAGFENEVEFENQEQILDNLNLLYVAFTRAIDKLHVLSAPAGNNQKTTSTWLEEFIQFTDSVSSTTIFEIGTNTIKQNQNKKNKNKDYYLHPLRFELQNSAIKIKSSIYKSENLLEASKRGLLVHQLLSTITSADQVEHSVEVAIQKGQILENEKNNFLEQLTTIVNHDLLKNYYLSDTKTIVEKELILQTGEILRPDRVIVLKDEVVIIDYKTGQKKLKTHTNQILKYAEALSSMGYSQLKKILVYIDDLEIVEVN